MRSMPFGVDEKFAAHLHKLLPAAAFPALDKRYLCEPRGRFFAESGLLIAPKTPQEVSAILRECNRAGVGVIPYGGGTGLVGGQIGAGQPPCVILSLARMRALRAIWPSEQLLIAEAGMILHDLCLHAENAGKLFPLWISSAGSCQLGGVLASNAGGLNVIKYGSARDLVVGIEAVFADGDIYNGLVRLHKDNTGYDLRNLLIGSEGTLGVITAATVKLCPIPTAKAVSIFKVPSPAAALALLECARDDAGDMICAFELLSKTAFTFLRAAFPDTIRMPFSEDPEWSVLIEIAAPCDKVAPQEVLTGLFAQAFERGLSDDGVIAQSHADYSALWKLRDCIPLANRHVGAIFSGDISLPLCAIDDFISQTKAALMALAPVRINCFGHLGDGNLHFNIFPPAGKEARDFAHLRADIQTLIHDSVFRAGGSISAEHGIGRLKGHDLQKYGDPVKLALMRTIKGALDPKGILNPGAIFI